MKKQVLIVISIALILTTTHIQAQWITNGNPTNFFGQLDNTNISNVNWTRSIGIGYFGANFTNSLLHVNSNPPWILPGNLSIPNAGEVFRTDGPAGVTHAWRMLSNNGTAGEKFNILNPNGTDNINMGTVQNGDLNFFAANAQRMTLIGTAGANQGFVGINTNSPTYTLTVNGTLAANKIIITTENKEQDLLALIAQLQSEVAELREKMTLQRN